MTREKLKEIRQEANLDANDWSIICPTFDVEEFFVKYRDQFPILGALSDRLRALPAGSVDCERLISLLS